MQRRNEHKSLLFTEMSNGWLLLLFTDVNCDTNNVKSWLNHISKCHGDVSYDEEESPVTPPKSAGNFFPTVQILLQTLLASPPPECSQLETRIFHSERYFPAYVYIVSHTHAIRQELCIAVALCSFMEMILTSEEYQTSSVRRPNRGKDLMAHIYVKQHSYLFLIAQSSLNFSIQNVHYYFTFIFYYINHEVFLYYPISWKIYIKAEFRAVLSFA